MAQERKHISDVANPSRECRVADAAVAVDLLASPSLAMEQRSGECWAWTCSFPEKDVQLMQGERKGGVRAWWQR